MTYQILGLLTDHSIYNYWPKIARNRLQRILWRRYDSKVGISDSIDRLPEYWFHPDSDVAKTALEELKLLNMTVANL